MDHCDGVHSANMTQIPGYKVKSMKTQALRKAKRTDVRVIAPATPVRRAN
ncbi:hypothetical protein [Roseibium denhamense]|nr:hypothetical protein [Roseibium denhamense]